MQDGIAAFPDYGQRRLDRESRVERLRPAGPRAKERPTRTRKPPTHLVHSLWPILRPHLVRHGSHPMAYATLQTGLDYFIDQSMGYMAHLSFRHRFLHRKPLRIAVSEPLCSPENRERMFARFLEEYRDVLFVQVGEDSARILAGLGLGVYQVGVEREVDLTRFSMSSRASAPLRSWRNRALAQGVEVHASPISRMPLDQVRSLCAQWTGHGRRREIGFLSRPLMLADEPDTRFFWAVQGDRLVGLAGFDPLYENGHVTGYHRSFDRVADSAPPHVADLLAVTAMLAFRSEGKTRLGLGLSPLAGLAKGYGLGRVHLALAGFVAAKCGFIHPFKANDKHKAAYGGETRPAYIAGTTGPLSITIASARACGLL